MERGQYFRLLIYKSSANQVIAMAQDLTFHGSAQVENSTTKDDGTGEWESNEITGLSYDITSTALVPLAADTANTLADIEAQVGDKVSWAICSMSGDDNRTIVATICSGEAIITQLEINAANKQNVTYQTSLKGFGPLVLPTL